MLKSKLLQAQTVIRDATVLLFDLLVALQPCTAQKDSWFCHTFRNSHSNHQTHETITTPISILGGLDFPISSFEEWEGKHEFDVPSSELPKLEAKHWCAHVVSCFRARLRPAHVDVFPACDRVVVVEDECQTQRS